ncbi:MAG: PPC domain-containing protein, partial [Anaerolineae bacterium]|nr:PPC domain-containing protein [Anaerolineae bacterium]
PDDKVLVRMSKSSGTMWPEVRVYGPDGVKLCDFYSSTSAEIASCTLTGGGAYSILAHDYFGTNTGDYYLYLQRLNNPGSALPIERGTVLDGAIVSPAQMDTYTFTATASGNVRVRMTAVSGSLWPGIRVYGPDGTKLCEDGAAGTAEITICALPGSGAYTILAFDSFDGTLTGGYRLGLDCCTIYLPLIQKAN